MAPEIFPAISAQNTFSAGVQYTYTSDIYSISLIIHELFGGGKNFFQSTEGIPHNVKQVQIYLAKCQRVSPELNLKLLHTDLRDIIRRGVDSDPKQRPSLQEFLAAISRLQ